MTETPTNPQPPHPGPANLSCSFCGKNQKEVKKLIAGPTVYICDECVALCNDIIAEDHELATKATQVPPGPEQLLSELDARVVGQSQAKRALAAALRLQYLQQEMDLPRAPRILLAGPTGSGKTTLGRAFCEVAGVAAHMDDVGRLSESGYVGEDVEHLVHFLLRAADHDVERAQRGVLVLDNVEKLKAERPMTFWRDVSGEGVQRELLRLLDGLVIEVPPKGGYRHPGADKLEILTSGMLVVASVRIDSPALGRAGTERAVRDTLVERGLLGAFVSRFDRVVLLDRLGAADFHAILMRPGGLIEEAARMASRAGGSLDITQAAVTAIADLAASSPDGAWSLRQAMQRLHEELFLSATPTHAFRIDEADIRRLLAAP